LRLQQGGPRKPKCGNVQYEIDVDLVKNALELRNCDPQPGDPEGKEPLRKRSKKLTPDQRAATDTAYAALSHRPGRGCGNDADPMTLIVTKQDGTKETYVGEQTACGKPPPEVAVGLEDFLSKVASIAFSR